MLRHLGNLAKWQKDQQAWNVRKQIDYTQQFKIKFHKYFRHFRFLYLTSSCVVSIWRIVLATRDSKTGPRSSWSKWISSKIISLTSWVKVLSAPLRVMMSHFSGVHTITYEKINWNSLFFFLKYSMHSTLRNDFDKKVGTVENTTTTRTLFFYSLAWVLWAAKAVKIKTLDYPKFQESQTAVILDLFTI